MLFMHSMQCFIMYMNVSVLCFAISSILVVCEGFCDDSSYFAFPSVEFLKVCHVLHNGESPYIYAPSC
jgi:hypothetical protein